MSVIHRILILVLVMATILGTSPANEDDLNTIVEGVEYHDQLIRTFRVSYTLRKQDGSGPERLRYGDCIFADGMILATEVIPAESIGDNGEQGLKTLRKLVYNKEEFMELTEYQPENGAGWKEFFYFPLKDFQNTFLHRRSPLFSTTVNLMPLSEFLKSPSVVSVYPDGYKKIEGDTCFRILCLTSENQKEEILINLDKGYRIQGVRSLDSENQNTSQEGDTSGSIRRIDWAHYKAQIWYPKKAYYEDYQINRSTNEKEIEYWEEIAFTNFEANIEIPADTFLMAPPDDAVFVKRPKTYPLTLTGTVVDALEATPISIFFRRISVNDTIYRTVRLKAAVARPLEIIKFTPPPGIRIHQFRSTVPDEVVFEAIIGPNLPTGTISANIVIQLKNLYIEGQNNTTPIEIAIPVEGFVEGELSLFPERFFFGFISTGKEKTSVIELKNSAKAPLLITKVDEHPSIKTTVEEISPGYAYTIRATVKPDAPLGTLEEPIRIHTEQQGVESVLEIPVSGIVR